MTKDPLVIFTPSGKRGNFPKGTPVLTAARQLGVDLDSVCGGRGICSKCHVEERYRSKRGLIEGRRLGCQATIQNDIVIDVPPESQVHKQVVRKRAEARDIVMDPATRLYYVEVEEPDMHEPSGDLERLVKALTTTTVPQPVRASPKSGRATLRAQSTASPSTLAPPPSRPIFATCATEPSPPPLAS